MALVASRHDEVVVGYVFDQSYAPHAGASMQSAVDAAAPGRPFRFVLVTSGLDVETRGRFEALAASRPQTRVEFHDVEPTADVPSPVFHPICFSRFALPRLAADAARILYLDSDTIVRRDLGALFDVDLGGAVAGGVHDAPMAVCHREGSGVFPHLQARFGQGIAAYHRDYLGLPPGSEQRYVNSGVLVLDASGWRAEALEDKLLAFARSRPHGLYFVDQDALNAVLQGRIRHIDPVWNSLNWDHLATAPEAKVAATRDPAIIHFTTFPKPWDDPFVSRAEHYWAARDRSPFAYPGGALLAQVKSLKARLDAEKARADHLSNWLGGERERITALERRLEGYVFLHPMNVLRRLFQPR